MTDISMIVAMANNRVIGVDNTLPWRLSADLKRFKAITMGKPIIMGRKTWDSIGRPLPGRRNIVVSRNVDLCLDGADVVPSLERAVELAKEELANNASQENDEIMIMGGATIYEQALPFANKLYITQLDLDIEGDAWFPEVDSTLWQKREVEHHHQTELDDQPAFDYHFENWVRS